MKKSRITLPAILVLVSLSLACQALPGSLFGVGEGTGGPADDLFNDQASPVNVTVKLEDKNSQTGMITPKGGQLKAEDAAGNRFTLDIPAGALAMDTEITMTPVASIDNLPLKKGLVGAVEFKPDGLFLYEDATLTIEPAKDVPVENQILFGYNGSGKDLHLAIPGKDYKKIQVRVPHFSGFGLGSGMATDRAALLLKRAADHEVRIQQQVAEVLSRERESQLAGKKPGDMSSLAEYFDSYYGLVVRPRILAAGSSCENGKLAIRTVLSYERNRQLLGLSANNDMKSGDFAGLLESVAAKCREEAVKECQAKVDPKILIQHDLAFEREKQLLGMESNVSMEKIVEEAVKTCGQSYKISGGADEFSGTGTICSITKPWKVTGSGVTVSFTPSSANGGSYSYTGSMSGISVYGNGTYTVNYRDGLAVSIDAGGGGTVSGGGQTASGSGNEKYTLTPTEGCR